MAFGVKSKHVTLGALPAGQVTVARAVLPCIPHLASLLRLVLPPDAFPSSFKTQLRNDHLSEASADPLPWHVDTTTSPYFGLGPL